MIFCLVAPIARAEQKADPVLALPGVPGISLGAIREKVKARQAPAAAPAKTPDTSLLFHDPVISVKESPAKAAVSDDEFAQALTANETFHALSAELPQGVSADDVKADLVAVHRDRDSRSVITVVNDLDGLIRDGGKFKSPDGNLDSEKLLTTLDSVGVPITGTLRRAVTEISRRSDPGAGPEQMGWIK